MFVIVGNKDYMNWGKNYRLFTKSPWQVIVGNKDYMNWGTCKPVNSLVGAEVIVGNKDYMNWGLGPLWTVRSINS